jgi:hypothetical protein
MSAHTPGPWHRNISAGGKYPTVFAGRNTHVAVAQQMPNPEETERNISLIAAAPDLLGALQLIDIESLPDDVQIYVRQAIAKATE